MAEASLVLAIGWVVAFAGWATPASRRSLVLGGLAAWLGLSFAIGASGVLAVFDSTPPRPMLFLAAITIGVVALSASRAGRALASQPVAVLILFQAFRIPVEVMIYGLADRGVMNEVMTFHGRNFDIVTGGLALILGVIGFGRPLSRGVAWAFNLIGIGLLVHVIVLAVLTLPTPFRVFTEGPANEVVMGAPFIWLPAVLVTAAMIGHIALTRRLLADQRAASAAKNSA